MFARLTCPACQHKFSIPEGDMGRRHVCPNCQSPFFAGKSDVETQPSAPLMSAGAASAGGGGYAKTMIGETAPPIKYNCPRCKTPLEDPASAAGTKKPCPSCGQRLMVPAAPPAPAGGQPNLNKTMMAGDESRPAAPPIKYNCPNCKKPYESPASEGGTKRNCPACGQRFQIPAAPPAGPNLNKTVMASDESGGAAAVRPGYPAPAGAGHAPGAAGAPAPASGLTVGSHTVPMKMLAAGAGVLFVLLLLACVVPALIRGGKYEDPEALAKHKQELEKLKAELDQYKAREKQHEQASAELKRELERQMARYDERQRDRDRYWSDKLREMEGLKDRRLAEEAEKKRAAELEEIARERREAAERFKQLELQLKNQAEENRRSQEALRQRETTVIHSPPVVYYPPYDPWYYRPWWMR
jgi:DNA-directed RNA polymerase subunit RPC12/RpoP